MLKKIFLFAFLYLFFSFPLYAEQLYTANKNNPPQTVSALETRLQGIKKAEENPLSIALYRPTYVLPFYYTTSPDQAVYQNSTPNNQKIMHTELKAQLSLVVPVTMHFFRDDTSLNIAYTQLSYWQVYASSQYFRETNYEPEIFVQGHFAPNKLWQFSLDHQSNGRGGDLERSWNRAILGYMVSGENWLFGAKAWALIFQGQSSNLHNSNIAHYLGYDAFLFSYKFSNKITASLQAQNIESAFTRGSVQFALSYPLSKHFLIYTQYFTGYGQSLIEYNHKTQSAGIGIAFNDWI